jgi:hypothetical protein
MTDEREDERLTLEAACDEAWFEKWEWSHYLEIEA